MNDETKMARLPFEIVERHARAQEETMQPDSCVTSSVAFTHHVDDEAWVSGLFRQATADGVKQGAEKIARRYKEKVDIMETYLNDLSDPTPKFLQSHDKVWVLTFKGAEGHMFAAVRDKRKSETARFYVWDTEVEDEPEIFFSKLSTDEVLARIKQHHQVLGYYYLIGFSK